MKFFPTAAALLLLTASAFAAEVDGKWNGTMNTPNGDVPVSFTFQSDGANLKGSTMGPDGMEVQIKNGKIQGDTIYFDIDFDFGGMPFTLSYKGVVSPGQIKFSIDVLGMPLELVVKKTT